MSIDMHAHWIPETLADALRARSELPYIRNGDDGGEDVHVPRGPVAIRPGHADTGKRVSDSAGYGVEKQVLSTSGTFSDVVQCAPPDEAAELAQIFNDGLAAACRDHPGVLFGVAALPCADMAAAVAEFERVIGTPGIIGALLPGNGLLTQARAQAFQPVFVAVQKHGSHIMIHSGNRYEDFADHWAEQPDNANVRRGTLDMQAKLSSIMVTLCLTDFLDPYPDVTVQVHNLGGNIPYEIERMDHLSLDRDPDTPPPSTRLDRVVVDCNSFSAPALELAVDVYGAERIMMGTDGSNFGVEWSLRAIAEADIGEAARESIRSGNAQRLIAAADRG